MLCLNNLKSMTAGNTTFLPKLPSQHVYYLMLTKELTGNHSIYYIQRNNILVCRILNFKKNTTSYTSGGQYFIFFF